MFLGALVIFNNLVIVIAEGPASPTGHMKTSSMVDFA